MGKDTLTFGSTPQVGERVLVLRREWMDKVFDGSKTLEIRDKRLREGDAWLGCKSVVYGKARLGRTVTIDNDDDWAALRPLHLVASTRPYKSTCGLPVLAVSRLHEGVPYFHPRGAVGIVKFKPRAQHGETWAQPAAAAEEAGSPEAQRRRLS